MKDPEWVVMTTKDSVVLRRALVAVLAIDPDGLDPNYSGERRTGYAQAIRDVRAAIEKELG